MGDPDEALEDPTPPDARVAQLPDDPADEIYQDPQDAVEVSLPVDVVTIDHAEVLEPPQVDPETDVSPPAAEDDPDRRVPVATHTLRVHGLFRLPDLRRPRGRVSRAKRQVLRNLSAVYHDTDDLRLARWEVTLRRRQGGVDEGWHLQLPVESQPGIREEVHLPLTAGEVGEVPHDMRELDPGVRAQRRREAGRQNCAPSARRTSCTTGRDGPLPNCSMTRSRYSTVHIAARFRELQVVARTHDAQLEPLVASA